MNDYQAEKHARARAEDGLAYTEGCRLFREATAGQSLGAVCRAIAVEHKTQVNAWLRGVRVPAPISRAKIAAVYPTVPAEAWARRSGGTSSPPPSCGCHPTAAAHGHTDGCPLRSPPAQASPASEAPPGPPPSALEDCLAVLAKIRAQRNRTDLMASEAIKLADSEARLLALRARLERDAERTEERIVREHPSWQRIKLVLVKTLAKKHPQALRDVAEALREDLAERLEG